MGDQTQGGPEGRPLSSRENMKVPSGGYITKCIDDVTHTRAITVRSNQEPWLTGQVHTLKAHNIAFRAGDPAGLRAARADPNGL
ncbi:hypothetical protein NHX12_027547 [Muraenolepis orangiensis]|uniref:Uncharacterized protein n=1 Tax=Muraenolepis orangiensis TaxID=630683 RepID=A0A9Q0IQJ5_9TELE|nr:hypothetical protein NHX12_027547 [Muraenolepis orangiensis]